MQMKPRSSYQLFFLIQTDLIILKGHFQSNSKKEDPITTVKNVNYTQKKIYYLKYILFAGFILGSHLNHRPLKVHCELWFGLITPKLHV